MGNLSTAGAASPSKFATGWTISVNDNQFVYGMLQCTSDLSDGNCYSCLQNIIGDIPYCCNWRSGGTVNSVSCILRYNSYLFFNLSSPLSPPADGSEGTTATNTTRGNGDGNLALIIICSLVIPVVSITILVIVVRVWWLWRPLRKENETEKTEDVDSLLFGLRH